MAVQTVDNAFHRKESRPVFPGGIKAWRDAGAFALVYFLAARAGQFIIYDPIPFTMLWVPSGLFVGVLLCSPPRRWPLFVAAAALANVGFNLSLGRNLPTGLGFFAADCLEAVTGAWLATRLGAERLEDCIENRELLAMLGAAGILSPALGAAVGATVAGVFSGTGDWINAWFSWWCGDSLGVVTAGIFMVAAHRYGRNYLRNMRGMRMFEYLAVLALLVGQAMWLFGDSGRFDYYSILIPGLLWMAMRFRVVMVSLAGLVLSVFSAAYIIHVSSLGMAPAEIVTHLQAQRIFLVVLVSTLIILSSYREFRRRVEAKLRKSEARLRLAQEAAKIGTWEWDLRTGRKTWSQELFGLYGFASGCCVPSHDTWLSLIHPDDRDEVAATVRAAARLGHELNIEWRTGDRDGKERWFLGRGRPRRDAQGNLATYIGVVVDITERKLAEIEAIEAGRKVQVLAKELAMSRERERAAVADDLHDGPVQLMAIATLLIEGLATKGRPCDEFAPALNMLRNALQMLRFTITDLSPQALKGASLGKALDGLARDIAIQHCMEVQISCEAPDDLTEESRALLYRASREFLVNAVKHGRASRARILVKAVGQDLSLTVEDNGVGFDNGRMNPLDRKSYGLANMRNLANSLGGKLVVDSKPGAGARVGMILPLASLL